MVRKIRMISIEKHISELIYDYDNVSLSDELHVVYTLKQTYCSSSSSVVQSVICQTAINNSTGDIVSDTCGMYVQFSRIESKHSIDIDFLFSQDFQVEAMTHQSGPFIMSNESNLLVIHNGITSVIQSLNNSAVQLELIDFDFFCITDYFSFAFENDIS